MVTLLVLLTGLACMLAANYFLLGMVLGVVVYGQTAEQTWQQLVPHRRSR